MHERACPTDDELAAFVHGRMAVPLLGRLAEHRLLKRLGAVKLIHPQIAGDAEVPRRFAREVWATAQLTHANTVAIYDYGHAEDGTCAGEWTEARARAWWQEQRPPSPVK